MNAPELSEGSYDYTEFSGKPLEFWQEHRRRNKKIAQEIGKEEQKTLSDLLPDQSLHKYIARVAKSAEKGHTTLLTTSGHVIQLVPATAKQKAVYVVDRDIDKDGIRVMMGIYAKDGFRLTPETLPFGANVDDEYKNHVRKLWAEVQNERAPKIETTAPAQTPRAAARVPAHA